MAILGKHSIGQMLVQAGKINNDQLQSALNMQENKDVYIGSIFKEFIKKLTIHRITFEIMA